MKKLFFSLIMAIVAVQAWAAVTVGTTIVNGDLSYKVTNAATSESNGKVQVQGLSTSGAAKSSLDLRIPAYLTYNNETLLVTSIKESAFAGKTSLRSVSMDYGVEEVNKQAFQGCTGITWVRMPSTMRWVYDNVFNGCTSLQSVFIAVNDPTGRVFNSTAFPSNSGMTLYVSKTCKSTDLFKNMVAFSKFATITQSEVAYDYKSGAMYLVCTKNPVSTNYGEIALTGIDATQLTDGAFSRSNSLIAFGPYKFYLTAVAQKACYGNTGIKSVNFTGCTQLATLQSSAFSGCTNLTEIVLNSGLKTIGSYAFENTAIPYIDIPASVTSLPISMVDRAKYCKSINVESANTTYATYEGVLYNKSKTKLLRVAEANSWGNWSDYSFPSTLTEIGEYAFDRCQYIKSVSIPYGVKTIGSYVFRYSSITSCKIPSGVTSVNKSLFYGCTNLETLYCNLKTVPTANSDMFKDCKKTNLYVHDDAVNSYKAADYWKEWSNIKSGAFDITDYCFKGDNGLNYEGHFLITSTQAQTRGEHKYDGLARMVGQYIYPSTGGTIEVPYELSGAGKKFAVTSIGKNVVYSTPNKDYTLKLSFNIDTIDTNAFNGQSHLIQLELNPGLKYLGSWAFKGCRIANDLVFSHGLIYLGAEAFSGCTFKKLLVPSSVSLMSLSAFSGLNKLEELVYNRNYSTSTGWDFTSVPSTCKLYVPTGIVKQFKNHAEWGKAFSNIQAGAYDFSFLNQDNTMYHYTITSTTPIKYNGTQFYGKAKYVYHPVHKTLDDWDAWYCNGGGIDQTNGRYMRYLITEIGDSCLAGCTSVKTTTLKTMDCLEKIGNYAFYQSGINELELPASVKTIGNYAFNSCKNLYQITCNATTPPTIQATTINTSYDKTLKVPDESVNAYKAANYWKNFYRIIGINDTPSGKEGDVDGNGTVDINDANILFNILLGKDTASKYNGRADVDGNGTVDITDANLIINILLGK